MEQREPSNLRGKSICLPCESEAEYLTRVDELQQFRQFLRRVIVSDLPKLRSKVPLRPCRGIPASMRPADLSYLLPEAGALLLFSTWRSYRGSAAITS